VPPLSRSPSQPRPRVLPAPAARAPGSCEGAGGEPGACRCACGSLLARLAEAGVELKCRRCKRTVLLPWPRAGRWEPLRAGPSQPQRPAVANPEPGTFHRGEL